MKFLILFLVGMLSQTSVYSSDPLPGGADLKPPYFARLSVNPKDLFGNGLTLESGLTLEEIRDKLNGKASVIVLGRQNVGKTTLLVNLLLGNLTDDEKAGIIGDTVHTTGISIAEGDLDTPSTKPYFLTPRDWDH